jgi:hypothetical protein
MPFVWPVRGSSQELSKSFLNPRWRLFESGIQKLLHLGLRFQRGLVMPPGDGSHGDSEVLGE